MKESSKVLIGVKEICAYLNITEKKFYELVKKGFPATKELLGQWTAHIDDINHFFRQIK